MNTEILEAQKIAYNISRNIYLLRKRRLMNSNQLARHSGLNKGTLHKIENELNANPCVKTLEKIAKAFEIELWELLKPMP